jgi:hypothetical protein
MYRGRHEWIEAPPALRLTDTVAILSAFAAIPGPIVAIAPFEEGIYVSNQIEIDLGLASVSDGALAMLEAANRDASLPPSLSSNLLDALAEEHLRRFGAQAGRTAVFRMPTRSLDPDELWHSLRLLGNWLSYADEASHGDPDLEAVSEVIARMWIGMRVALNRATDGTVDEPCREIDN